MGRKRDFDTSAGREKMRSDLFEGAAFLGQ